MPEIEDGGNIYISCSNCRAFLLDILITRPKEESTWKIIATCPFCGDKSFIKEIRGGFAATGFYKTIDENPVEITKITNQEFNKDQIIFTTKKAREDVRPVYNKK